MNKIFKLQKTINSHNFAHSLHFHPSYNDTLLSSLCWVLSSCYLSHLELQTWHRHKTIHNYIQPYIYSIIWSIYLSYLYHSIHSPPLKRMLLFVIMLFLYIWLNPYAYRPHYKDNVCLSIQTLTLKYVSCFLVL